MANIMRSLNATSKSGKWLVGKTDTTLAQTIFRSPTVFNFFDPHYSSPGVIQNAGLVSPEFDILYETTITNAQNMIYTGIYANYNPTAARCHRAPVSAGMPIRSATTSISTSQPPAQDWSTCAQTQGHGRADRSGEPSPDERADGRRA